MGKISEARVKDLNKKIDNIVYDVVENFQKYTKELEPDDLKLIIAESHIMTQTIDAFKEIYDVETNGKGKVDFEVLRTYSRGIELQVRNRLVREMIEEKKQSKSEGNLL